MGEAGKSERENRKETIPKSKISQMAGAEPSKEEVREQGAQKVSFFLFLGDSGQFSRRILAEDNYSKISVVIVI